MSDLMLGDKECKKCSGKFLHAASGKPSSKAALPFLSHYAQKYVMEKYANKPVLDDGGYEDQLFAALDVLCTELGEPLLDRAELIELAKQPNRLMWSA